LGLRAEPLAGVGVRPAPLDVQRHPPPRARTRVHLAFGIDLASKVALGVTLVFFIVFFATFAAVRDVDQTLVDNVRILGARRRDVTFDVLLPAAFSAIVASLRTSAGFAFAGAVVAEYIGSNAGLGRRIATAEAFFDSTGVFGGIVLIALLALLL